MAVVLRAGAEWHESYVGRGWVKWRAHGPARLGGRAPSPPLLDDGFGAGFMKGFSKLLECLANPLFSLRIILFLKYMKHPPVYILLNRLKALLL